LTLDSTQINQKRFRVLDRIMLLNQFYPKNASLAMQALEKGTNIDDVSRMIDAVDIELTENKAYQTALKKLKENAKKRKSKKGAESAFAWMNIMEWQDFKVAVAKDKAVIDSVANLTGVEGRLIVACLVGEQIRLFNSKREAYKQWIGPLKILSVESQFSYGVTGIKIHTAQQIEYHLKNSKSKYYLGPQYDSLLNFTVSDTAGVYDERISRLTDFKNHFYSYMYAAIFVKQVKMQWERAGFPIHDRPEILTTLFNVGYPQSVPKKNPRVGGSSIMVNDKKISFGAVTYQFYFSGELMDIFPYKPSRFDWLPRHKNGKEAIVLPKVKFTNPVKSKGTSTTAPLTTTAS
jgi:hypothetical protein